MSTISRTITVTQVEEFQPGAVVQHFKRTQFSKCELEKRPNIYLYRIIGLATHTDTDEKFVIYQALYGDHEMFARPKDEFLSEVDHKKYPYILQKYRFELYSGPATWEDK